MKSDIDRLMAEQGLDAIIVLGDEAPNPYRDYLTRRSKANGLVVKKRDQEAIFITLSGMEIAEAAKSGLTVHPMSDFSDADFAEKYKGDPEGRQRATYWELFHRLGITGKVAFYGVADVGNILALIGQLLQVPNVEFVIGGAAKNLFSRAYETKDPDELAQLQDSAKLTCEVVRRTWEFISQHYAQAESIGSPVVNEQGDPLTIGAVKRFIRLQEFDLGLDDPEGCIFAQGADAGYPHSQGEADDMLVVGKSIVFDIFPRGLDSGYFHDMTRTWCLGQAPTDVQGAYDDVMAIFKKAKDALKVGEAASTYEIMTLDYFESKGYPTHRSKPGIDGYVHSLGHGLGLNIHESPYLGTRWIGSVLQPGNVFTVEPGLYYPNDGFGVRIEDTVYFDAEGRLHTLTDFPYTLVLPVRKRQ